MAAAATDQAVEDRIPDGTVLKEDSIPVEGQIARRKSAHALAVEGINDEDGDGQIQEGEDGEGMKR